MNIRLKLVLSAAALAAGCVLLTGCGGSASSASSSASSAASSGAASQSASEPAASVSAEENGAFLGYVIYHAYDAESVEIGWVLFPESWGRGYASALTDLLIGRARREQKDVVLECVPAQEATKRIAVKKGFHDCGISDGLAVYRLCGKNQNAGSS